jgi:hypothetical protein
VSELALAALDRPLRCSGPGCREIRRGERNLQIHEVSSQERDGFEHLDLALVETRLNSSV